LGTNHAGRLAPVTGFSLRKVIELATVTSIFAFETSIEMR
jgi:hypothetical protein